MYSVIVVIHIDLNYIAGFFDGEGCARATKVGACKYKDGKERRRLWKPMIDVSNTNEEVIREIHDFLKIGKVYVHHNKHNPKIKDQWRLCIWGYKDIIQFCDLIMEKTVVKKEILKLVREFAIYVESTKMKHKTWTNKRGNMGWTDEDIEFVRQKFVVPIRDLIRMSSNKGRRTVMI